MTMWQNTDQAIYFFQMPSSSSSSIYTHNQWKRTTVGWYIISLLWILDGIIYFQFWLRHTFVTLLKKCLFIFYRGRCGLEPLSKMFYRDNLHALTKMSKILSCRNIPISLRKKPSILFGYKQELTGMFL